MAASECQDSGHCALHIFSPEEGCSVVEDRNWWPQRHIYVVLTAQFRWFNWGFLFWDLNLTGEFCFLGCLLVMLSCKTVWLFSADLGTARCRVMPVQSIERGFEMQKNNPQPFCFVFSYMPFPGSLPCMPVSVCAFVISLEFFF